MCIVKKIEVSVGDKYEMLTVIKEVDNHITSGGNKKRVFSCKCECNNIVNVTLNELRNGGTKSCGCLNTRNRKVNLKTHGKTGTRMYNIWKGMRKRCNNNKSANYKHYGARGISVCDEWDDFVKFEKWAIEKGYEDTLSIERIDNDKGYYPENCKWITMDEQKLNTRQIREFEAISPNGEKFIGKVQKHFAEKHNLKAFGISDCLQGKQLTHKGWKFKHIE